MSDLEAKVCQIGGTMPSVPSAWDKNVPKIIALIGLMIGGAGAAYSKQVETDPETKEVVSTKYDIGAIMTAAAGFMAALGSNLYQANNSVKAENAANHIATTAVAAVQEAAASPPIDSLGRMSLEHSLTMAVVQAAQEGRLVDASKVLTLIGALEEGKCQPSNKTLLSPEEAA